VNRQFLLLFIGAGLIGLGLGAIEAAIWLRTLAATGTDWAEAFKWVNIGIWIPAALITLGLIAACYSVASIYTRTHRTSFILRAVFGVLTGVAACWLIIELVGSLRFVTPIYTLKLAVVFSICLSILAYITIPRNTRSIRTSVLFGVAVAAVWTGLVTILRLVLDSSGELSLGGFGIFSSLVQTPETRVYPSLVKDTTTGLLLGGFAGTAAYRLINREWAFTGTLWGAFLGAWISGLLYAAHIFVGTLIMQSAYSNDTAITSSLIVFPFTAVVLIGGIITFLPYTGSRRYKFIQVAAITVVLTAVACYIYDAWRGSEYYLAAVRIPNNKTRAYIHFHKDGGWTRTLEGHNDNLKIEMCDRLLSQYPRNIYAAQALYLKARCQFASWQFDKAADTLSLLRKRYPGDHSIAALLQVHAYLAQGQYKQALTIVDQASPELSHCFADNGRMVIAHAYEVMGNNDYALGQYVYYINDIQYANRSAAWSPVSIRYAEQKAAAVMKKSAGSTFRGVVSGRFLTNDGPLAGVHVALVQPHIDALSPDDTRQFTSALTVPLWFGLGATSGADGRFTIENVPYGDYEVVIGFDIRTPGSHVLSSAIPPVCVDRSSVRLCDIQLTQSIHQIKPINNQDVGTLPELVWDAYPDAAYYSVSVIAQPYSSQGPIGDVTLEGYTCWARTKINGTSVKVTPEWFIQRDEITEEARLRHLVPKRTYMWIVVAYDQDGRIISSSEQYRFNQDSTFKVKSDALKGGW